MARKPFSAPIPGMSLTDTPKNAPWERPPEITDPQKAVEAHLDRLIDADRMEAILHLIEVEDFTIKEVTSALVRSAVANGIHSIDVGLIVSPAIHQFIKKTADSVGVEYEEGFVDKKEKGETRDLMIGGRAAKMLKKANAETPKVNLKDVREVPEEEAQSAMEFEEELPDTGKETSKGLMSRRVE